MNKFTSLLFKDDSFICSGCSPYETESKGVADVTEDESYITLNTLVAGSTRADKNVDSLRNFLVEFDEMAIDDQIDHVESIKLPFATCVFSGNKSCHFVVSLAEPVETREEYDNLVRWLYAAVPGCDPSCKNPSRFTRLGGGTHKNGTKQDIIQLGSTVNKEDLIAWMGLQCDEPKNTSRGVKQIADEDFMRIQKSGYRAKMHKATLEFCKTGGRKGFRHKNAFIAACNLRDCYYTLEETKFLVLGKLTEIYKLQGREEDVDLKERAIEDAFLQQPRTQTRS